MFTWFYNTVNCEYEVFLDGEIFCHIVGEKDWAVFSSMVKKSGNKLLRIV